MATDSSFDVVSKVDPQELDNALNQTRKEIAGRFDFKNSKTEIESAETTITILSDDELKLKNVIDILQTKLLKRGIDLKSFAYGKVEPATGSAVRQVVTVKSGIAKEKIKPLVEAVKASKLKVQAQYQDEQIRVSAKSKDDLQKILAILRGLDFELPLQFVNFR